MKKSIILLFLFCSCGILRAQLKPKANTQPAKPSKQTTIKYINDKLNENCVGKWDDKTTTLYEYDRDLAAMMEAETIFHSFIYQSYSIEENNGNAFIEIHIKTESLDVDHKSHENKKTNGSILIEVSVTKISDILFLDIPRTKKESPASTTVEETYGLHAMIFRTEGNNISANDNEAGTRAQYPLFSIPSFNRDDEEKLKKAILNLRTYYKTENDPFDN